MTTDETNPAATPPKPWYLRYLGVFILLAAAGAVYWFGFQELLSLDTLKEQRETLTAWVAENQILAVAGFIAIYTAVVAISLPGGAFMTLLGGFLFGTWFGALWVVIAATLGATIIFLIARYAFADILRAKARRYIEPLEKGFNENGLSYMLTLRLIPVFPFWVVNLVPALIGVGLPVFVIATFFGIIPGTLVFASIGAGLGSIFDRGEEPDLSIIFSPQILLPLLGLAALSLLPALYRALFKREKE